jgi:hypothetical protein
LGASRTDPDLLMEKKSKGGPALPRSRWGLLRGGARDIVSYFVTKDTSQQPRNLPSSSSSSKETSRLSHLPSLSLLSLSLSQRNRENLNFICWCRSVFVKLTRCLMKTLGNIIVDRKWQHVVVVLGNEERETGWMLQDSMRLS